MDNVPSELNQKLRAVKWLLIDTGIGHRPQDVIYLMGMEDEVIGLYPSAAIHMLMFNAPS